MTAPTAAGTCGRVGESARRVDAVPKVEGAFAFSSDLRADGMLFGVTVRSPHPHARIVSIDIAEALAAPGVAAVLTAGDLPAKRTYGTEFADQAVLASDVVRFIGEPVALVAADHPESARIAARLVTVDYDPLPALFDMEEALAPDAVRLRDFGNVLRHIRVEHGDPDADADVWVDGYYETGMQDQAPLGPESGLAVPADDGGVDLHVATQWVHMDRRQLAPCLGLPEDKVRIYLAGIGGAFGAREDLSIQIHACLLALHTGRPVRMSYTREESFLGHVHRHPSRIWMRTGATSEGKLVVVHADLLLDGGAFASSSPAVLGNAVSFATGPYQVPNALVRGTVVFTNNPPCGAMRGFGSVQAAFAYEAQMDRLAAALDVDPVELRLRNALTSGSVLPTGQVIRGSAPTGEVIERCVSIPPPPPRPDHPMALPGGAGNSGRGGSIRRGTGFAFGYKNITYSEGFDDAASVRVRLAVSDEGPTVEVHTAAAEVGQGLHTVLGQIARTELGIDRVVVLSQDTGAASAGSTSASRQTLMTGGALHEACMAVKRELFARAEVLGFAPASLSLGEGRVLVDGVAAADVADLLERPVDVEHTYHHPPTTGFDDQGRGDIHTMFVFAAARAVVDVDVDLGLVKVVQVATAQDVGKAINPRGVEGQIEGGVAQGLGLALNEELVVRDGRIHNPSFTDYLLPTILDMPEVVCEIVEEPEPGVPMGVKGAGESSIVVAPAAIAAAVRDATGRELNRIPIRPDDLVGLAPPTAPAGPPPRPDVPGPRSLPYYQGLGIGDPGAG